MAQLLSMASAGQNSASLTAASSNQQQAAALASLAAAGFPSTVMPAALGAFAASGEIVVDEYEGQRDDNAMWGEGKG
uniref:Uncharacterized protein n=1 Tax=Syphacia muris TaxID=451379 RepID=A0A0N5AWA7_9BILA